MPPRIDKETVLDAAMRLLVVDSGATTTDIARSVGIGRATLHRMYPSRRALMEALAARGLASTRAVLDELGLEDGPVLEVMAALVERLGPVADQFRFLAIQVDLDKADLAAFPRLTEAMASLEGRLVAFFRRGQAEGVFRPDLPAGWLCSLLGSTLIAASEAVRIGAIGRREAPHLVLTSFLSGVAQPAR